MDEEEEYVNESTEDNLCNIKMQAKTHNPNCQETTIRGQGKNILAHYYYKDEGSYGLKKRIFRQ